MSSKVEIIVRGYHLDVYQHVNNARYLEFLEEGRWAYLGTPEILEYWKNSTLGFVVVNININFRQGAKMNDLLEIETKTDHYTDRKGVMKQIIRLKGTDTVIADAEVSFVIIDVTKNKAVPINDEIKSLLQRADEAE